MKYKKLFKSITTNLMRNTNSTIIKYVYGLKLLKNTVISDNLLEAIRKFIIRKLKYLSTIYLKVKPIFYQTKKAIGARMGKGFGSFISKFSFINAGSIIIEFFSIHFKLLKYLIKSVKKKLPVNSLIIIKKNFYKLNN